MSAIFRLAPFSRSISSRWSTPLFFNTRSVLRSARITSTVSSSLALTNAFFTFGWTGASLVAMNRVPMFMPAAPIDSAATRLRASAMPPEATNGIFNSSAARGNTIMFGMSSSPGWSPHSNPSTLTASHPIFSAFSECRTEVHLWITLMPAALSSGIYCSGLRPAVSTTLTPHFLDRRDIFRIGRRGEAWQEGEVHAERLVGHVATTRDFLGEQFRRLLRQAGNDTKAAGVGDGGGKLGKADIMHAALDDRMLDAEQFSDCCLHERSPLFRSVDDFKQSSRAHAAADAHGHHAVFRLTPPTLDQDVAGQSRTGHAVGMADCDRAAIDVELFGIDAELVAAIDHLNRIGFVELPEIDVVDLQIVARQKPRDRGDRADAHLIGLDAGGDKAAEDAEGLQALLRGDLVAHDHAGRGAIRELAGIAGADRLAFEHGLDLRQSFGGGIRTRAFVFIQRHLLVGDLLRVLVDHRHLGRDRHDLVIEVAALHRGADSALALQAVLVLLVTADLVALGDHFRRLRHRHVHFRLHRHQLVVDGMEFVHVLVLNQADRLDASADRDLDAVEHHRARRDRDRLQAGSALPVDGGAGDGDRQSGADRTF